MPVRSIMPSVAGESGTHVVAFDVTPVIAGRTGIARYATQLGAALERHGAELQRFAIGRRSFPLPPKTKHLAVPSRVTERWWRLVPWPPIERLVGPAEVVHATGLLAPATRRPLVVTVHDIAAVRYPELHPPRHVRQQQAQLKALAKAAAITTVSAATADDLVHLGIDRGRIVVAPLGVTPLGVPAPVPGGPQPGYLLTVGETSPRKRYDVLMRALARAGGDLRLIMSGPPAADDQRLRALAVSLGVDRRVARLGAVDDATLSGLYRGALALCFPSVSEGFGLPVLEAMDAGVPVVASDIPTTREVAGDAALYPASDDAEAWRTAIETIASDPALRERLAEAGRRRAAGFTWDRAAAATLEAYRLAVEVGV